MTNPPPRHVDESPIRFDLLHGRLPTWIKRHIPTGGGDAHDQHGKGLFGFVVFLLSESMVFAAFFLAYFALRLTTPNWLPPGVSGLEVAKPAINTVVLVSSSFVIYFAERALKRHQLGRFRFLWLLTSAMGIYFLVGQAIEWSGLPFNLQADCLGPRFTCSQAFTGCTFWQESCCNC